jgi:hypothetical protein
LWTEAICTRGRYAPLSCEDEDSGGLPTVLCAFNAAPEIIVNYNRETPRRAGDDIKVNVRGVNEDGSSAPLTVVETVNCVVVAQDDTSISLRINIDEPMVPNINNISFTIESSNCAGKEFKKVSLCTYNPLVARQPIGLNVSEGDLPATICVYDEAGNPTNIVIDQGITSSRCGIISTRRTILSIKRCGEPEYRVLDEDLFDNPDYVTAYSQNPNSYVPKLPI